MAGPSREALPVCFDLPSYGPEVETSQLGDQQHHQLHGADDLISLFGLKSLWERSVKPYTSSSRSAAGTKRHRERSGQEAKQDGSTTKQEGTVGADGTGSAEDAPRVMEKTYVDYVRNLQGKVRPPKRTISRFHSAFAAAQAAGEPLPSLPVEVTGRTTMRDIVFRPETTVQRVVPFDEDTLRAAFTVEAGNVQDIDLSLLDSDEVERQSPSKKKRKRKHQRDPTDRAGASDETAAKRSKLNAIISGRPGMRP